MLKVSCRRGRWAARYCCGGRCDLGGWLIGIGALVIVLGHVFGSEQPYTGRTYRGPFNTTGDRLRFAVEGSGAGLVASGSVVLAIADPPSLWLLVVLPTAYIAVHVLVAWKLRQYWMVRLVETERAGRAEDAMDLQARMWRCAQTCSSWSWCLSHPYNEEYWPQSVMPHDTEQADGGS